MSYKKEPPGSSSSDSLVLEKGERVALTVNHDFIHIIHKLN